MKKGVLLLALLLLAAPVLAQEPQRAIAMLTHATGQVTVRQGEKWLQVDTVPVDLYSGDKVATEQGRAEIYFWRDGSTLVLDVGTNLTITETEEQPRGWRILRRIQIFLGDVWFELKRSFRTETELVTPTAVGGLRGTQGMVHVRGEEESEFVVMDGELEVLDVRTRQRHLLRARQILRALRDQAVRIELARTLPTRLLLDIPPEQLPKVRERLQDLLRQSERHPPLEQLPKLSLQPGFVQRELLRRELLRQLRQREELLRRQRERPEQYRPRPQPKLQKPAAVAPVKLRPPAAKPKPRPLPQKPPEK